MNICVAEEQEVLGFFSPVYSKTYEKLHRSMTFQTEASIKSGRGALKLK